MPPLWPSLMLLAGITSGAAAATDAFYHALLGEPQVVEVAELIAAPGRYVGQAVRVRGRLERENGNGGELRLTSGSGRVLLRLEPGAAAFVHGWGLTSTGLEVEVDGLFYREPDREPGSSTGAHAMRCWRVAPLQALDERPASPAPVVSLEALAYGGGRYDGQTIRVRGVDRGRNPHNDLPETTRRSRGDWVLKDGYFAVWVGGAEPGGKGKGRESGAVLEVVGVPSTVNGVVRIAAQSVQIAPEPTVAAVSGAPTAHPGWAALPPCVIFVYPVRGQRIDPAGHVIVQFSKPMDPARFDEGVRVRYEREGAVAGSPAISLQYRDRSRALVITPDPPPPPGSDLVVELLDVLVDVGGARLVRRGSTDGPSEVVERIRFSTVP
jgi:hypothetical protein